MLTLSLCVPIALLAIPAFVGLLLMLALTGSLRSQTSSCKSRRLATNVVVTLIMDSEFAHILPESASVRDVKLEPLFGQQRASGRVGTLSSSSNTFPALNGRKAVGVWEPIVWSQAYLDLG